MKVWVYTLNDPHGWAAECVRADGSREKAIFFGAEAEAQARDWARRSMNPNGLARQLPQRPAPKTIPAFMIAANRNRGASLPF